MKENVLRITKCCIIFCSLLIFSTLCAVSVSIATTYYVDDSRSDDNGDGLTWLTAKKYIKSGISMLESGDTLIIADGTYTGDNNCLYFYTGIPNGTAGHYTTIKAFHDFKVTIDGENNRSTWIVGSDSSPISYVKFEGMIFANSTKSCFSIAGVTSNHCKVLRCAAHDAGLDNTFNFTSLGSYHLFEDCFAWGQGRYKFCCGKDHIILRRCVVRYDYHNPTNAGINGNADPYACFAFYQHTDCVYQNCIAIDGLDIHSTESNPYQCTFQGANGSIRCGIDSCISLNNENFYGVHYEGSSNPDMFVRNSIFWDLGHFLIWNQGTTSGHPFVIDHCTLGLSLHDYSPTIGAYGSNGVPYAIIQNTIVQDLTLGTALRAFSLSDYNALFNNGTNYYDVSAGAHDLQGVSGVDVLDGMPGNGTVALKYLLRIENGSDLDGAGSDGSDIGSTIITKLGVSCTSYGEDGWDEDTDKSLWPFPNEDKIKELMSDYDLHGVDGKRGFCADSVGLYGGRITLTSYIWEYLGNPCPVDVCNYYDVNRDRHVNVQDVQIVVNHILGRSTSEYADTTGDESVNIQDVQGVVNVILVGKQA